MKQAGLDRVIRQQLKQSAKSRGWKQADGSAYWRLGELFFHLGVFGTARQQRLHYSLHMKWFSLDETLWRILGMPENITGPPSLHANGAFTIRGEELFSGSVTNMEWTPNNIHTEIENVASQAAAEAGRVRDAVRDIDGYIAFIERSHNDFMARHPGAIGDLWKERLLVAVEKGNHAGALSIASARVKARDTGSFMSNGRTFYELATEYLSQ